MRNGIDLPARSSRACMGTLPRGGGPAPPAAMNDTPDLFDSLPPEAAGAGESGRRFSVVADEIRKHADRVGGSTKEIRSLIEEVRAAATTTVMVTEDGSKAVDASARQFGEVAASFRRIVDLLGNTAQAAREIELSTKQQTTAVEQASTAITDVAQTARETEASSGQTMETSNQLASLSQQLIRLVRSSERA